MEKEFLDSLLFDKATISKIKEIIASIDPKKLEAIISLLQPDENGNIKLKFDITLKNN